MEMEFNSQVTEILKEHRIGRSEGLLVLLGIYYNLDVEKVCPEQIVGAINLTGIVTKDYSTNSITWNIPLFTSQTQDHFNWVRDWVEAFGKINIDRKGSWQDATKRMKEFFKQYPQYRKEDVYKARDLYFSSLNNAKFCMHSHKFIFDGMGASKKSTLLQYCERVVDDYNTGTPDTRYGEVIS